MAYVSGRIEGFPQSVIAAWEILIETQCSDLLFCVNYVTHDVRSLLRRIIKFAALDLLAVLYLHACRTSTNSQRVVESLTLIGALL